MSGRNSCLGREWEERKKGKLKKSIMVKGKKEVESEIRRKIKEKGRNERD